MHSSRRMMKEMMTGRPVREIKITSPLIKALESARSEGLLNHRGYLKIGPKLGYQANFTMSWEQALNWCKPQRKVHEGEVTSAESRRIKTFQKKLSIFDLIENTIETKAPLFKMRYGGTMVEVYGGETKAEIDAKISTPEDTGPSL